MFIVILGSFFLVLSLIYIMELRGKRVVSLSSGN